MIPAEHILRSKRITLSGPDESDIDRIAQLCQDPAIQAWTTIPSPYSREDARDFVSTAVLEGWRSGQSLNWAIRVIGASELIGVIGFHSIASRQGEVGYWLGSTHRGQGYLQEAIALVLDHGFAPSPFGLGLQRVVWHAFVGNTASAEVARRQGFRFEGTARLGGLQRGVRKDSWQAGLLAGDARTPVEGWPESTFVRTA